MNYSSTRGKDKDLNFVDVMLNGLAKDGGLYVPDIIPKFNLKDLEKIRNLRYCDLAYDLTMPFIVNKEISEEEYKCICEKTYSRSFGKELISINKLNEKEYILNLFHGPTYAFKDYALQLLGNLYDFILKKKKTINNCRSNIWGYRIGGHLWVFKIKKCKYVHFISKRESK